jgi:hypothetical protein
MAIEVVEIKGIEESGANRYKVPLKKWRKWNVVARRVFNETYSSMSENQNLFLHPHQDKISNRMWRTTAWNAAWIAADAV